MFKGFFQRLTVVYITPWLSFRATRISICEIGFGLVNEILNHLQRSPINSLTGNSFVQLILDNLRFPSSDAPISSTFFQSLILPQYLDNQLHFPNNISHFHRHRLQYPISSSLNLQANYSSLPTATSDQLLDVS